MSGMPVRVNLKLVCDRQNLVVVEQASGEQRTHRLRIAANAWAADNARTVYTWPHDRVAHWRRWRFTYMSQSFMNSAILSIRMCCRRCA